MKRIIGSVLSFYVEGFRGMKLGKKLWLIVAVKLFILFFVIKLLFFPDVMKERFHNDAERTHYILDQLTKE